ncbi:uncharacterized protein LOC129915401 [Episyrphus balteatus]|uniref:uncharacterized protein LOC129915401 n=1 Tax=Episyrphus balteatus TaxID=286459 RepID=UPI0024856DA3|nr:uncharacterized protein LOC129915401 [Episyrphus balteatus]
MLTVLVGVCSAGNGYNYIRPAKTVGSIPTVVNKDGSTKSVYFFADPDYEQKVPKQRAIAYQQPRRRTSVTRTQAAPQQPRVTYSQAAPQQRPVVYRQKAPQQSPVTYTQIAPQQNSITYNQVTPKQNFVGYAQKAPQKTVTYSQIAPQQRPVTYYNQAPQQPQTSINSNQIDVQQLPFITNNQGVSQQRPTSYIQTAPQQSPITYSQAAPKQSPITYTQTAPQQSPITYSQAAPQQSPITYTQTAPQQSPITYSQAAPQQSPITYNQIAPQQSPITYNQIAPQQVPTIINQVAPQQPQYTQEAPVAKKNLQVIFVKTPGYEAYTEALLKMAKEAIQSQTIVYVLSKEPDVAELTRRFQDIKSSSIKMPEVRFIKYKTDDEAVQAQQAIQAQYESLPGPSNSFGTQIGTTLGTADQTGSINYSNDAISSVTLPLATATGTGNNGDDLNSQSFPPFLPTGIDVVPGSSYLPPSQSGN